MKKLVVFLVTIFVTGFSTNGQTTRYIDSEFTSEQTHTNQVYVTASQLNDPYVGENATSNVDLKMHIFQPQGDDLQTRPMLVCIHGGGFVSGSKEHDDMLTFCQIFTEKGYVTATVQYRLGMNLLSNTSGERSVYRGIQDGRALLRWIRENAAVLGVSPDHIYLLGSSAGAFIALHNLFMDKESERPAGTYQITGFTTDAGPDLGALDAIGDFFTHSSQANGIIALWGALKHTDLIEASGSNIPIFLVHGTVDTIVPFGLGSPFQAPNLAATYGSQLISQKLTELGFSLDTYFVNNEGHEFYGVTNGNWDNGTGGNAYWDIVVEKVRDFLFAIHKPAAAFEFNTNVLEVTFTNNTVNGETYLWDFGDGQTSTDLNPIHAYPQEGEYTVTLTAYSPVMSADIITQQIILVMPGVDDELKLPLEFLLSQNYPNPFNPNTTITYALPEKVNVDLRVFNLMGEEVTAIVSNEQEAGVYEVKFDAYGLASGVYFYKLKAGTFIDSKKMIYVK